MTDIIEEPAKPRHPWPLALRLAIFAATVAAIPAGALVNAFNWGPLHYAGLVLMVLGTIGVPFVITRFFVREKMAKPAARYTARMTATMLLYLAALFFSLWAFRTGLTAGPLGYLIAVAPALPILAIFVHVGVFMRESDEFVRRIMLEATGWSAAITLAEATIYGFLETFGKAPHVWMWFVPVAFFAQLGVTMPIAQWKYR
jgi:hypothetical protein